MVKLPTPSLFSKSAAGSATRLGAPDDPRLVKFAREVNSLEELEPAARIALAQHVERDDLIRQITVAPRQRLLGANRNWFNSLLLWKLTPDWVLVLTETHVVVAATTHPGAKPVVISTPILDILSLEMGTILLHAWVEWSWANQGRLDCTRIYFNAVGQRWFMRALEYLRRDLINQAGPQPAQTARHLDYLAGLPFKFANIILYDLLLPTEQVQAVIYRPAIWSSHRGLFRRQRAPAMTLVLSNYHILIAEEDLTGRECWGLITRFCPRSRICHATLEREQDSLWLNLVLDLQEVRQEVRIHFEFGAEQAISEMLALLQAA